VVDVPKARWRRSGVGGFHYYAWWFPTTDWDGVQGAPSVVVRAVRHHDEMRPLAAGDAGGYFPRRFADLDPLTEEQAEVLRSPARIRLVVGQPGTGKTSALIFAAIHEARSLPPEARLLYVTLSRRLADLAQEYLTGIGDPGRRVDVVPLAHLLAEWSGLAGGSAASDDDEERAFLDFVKGFAPRDLAVWQGSTEALWAEVRAHVLGAALPFPVRSLPASQGPILDQASYRRVRDPVIGAKAARAAWHAAGLFVERRDLPSVQREAWTALERLRGGQLDRELRGLGGLIVDELQDLTLLQIAVLAEATRRSGEWRVASGDGRCEPAARPYPDGRGPLFVAAGDESQIVHPSGFDWGWCKDLLTGRLGRQPEEIALRTNQRSAVPVIEVANRTALLYDELPREYRPRGSARAEKTEAPNGEVALAAVAADDAELAGWLERLASTPHSAVIVDDRTDPRSPTQPRTGEATGPDLPSHLLDRFRDLLFTPGEIKGLDRQYVVIWDASRAIERLRGEIAAAHGRGQQSRFLVARTAIDELRVAVSRATETLVFLDALNVEPDPMLSGLLADGVARRRSVAFLRDRLEERNADPRERALGFLDDAADLLERDLDRALRTLVRAEAALADLVDAGQRRGPLERAVEVRRRAAHRLIQEDRDAEASEQLERLLAMSRELGEQARAEQYAALARRYREAPRGTANAAERLPALLAAYIDTLEALPPDDRSARLYALPREWLEEARGLAADDELALRSLRISALRLAELTGAERDRATFSLLSEALVDRLLEAGACADALEILSREPDPPPQKLARCHEGLKAWRAAAEARLAANQPAEALENYRRAAAFPEAAGLAERLGQEDVASTLGLLAGLAESLDRLEQADLKGIADAETQSLARRLRDTADLLTRRRRRRP
jgi:hypothetical protein